MVRPLAFHLLGRGFDSQARFLNAIRTQSSCEKSKSLRSVESRGFPPGTPVSSHRESRQGGLGDTGHSNWFTLLWCPCPCGEVK